VPRQAGRINLRPGRLGYLEEYPQYPNGTFGDAVPRGGNAGGGGQPGWVLKCKGWETDPNAYIYFTIQEQNWEQTCEASASRNGAKDPAYATGPRPPAAHLRHLCRDREWLADKTKFEAVDILKKFEVHAACAFHEGPCLRSVPARKRQHRRTCSMRRAARIYSRLADEVLRLHAQHYGAPLLGEHTDEV